MAPTRAAVATDAQDTAMATETAKTLPIATLAADVTPTNAPRVTPSTNEPHNHTN